jgi:hypothetical protein
MPLATFVVDFITTLREWVDDFDVSEPLALSWIAMAEERMNNELRVPQMVQRREVQLVDQCVPVPDDMLEIINVRYTADSAPLRWVSSDEYWRIRGGAQFYLAGAPSTEITYLDPDSGVMINPPLHQPAFIDYPGRSGPTLPLGRNVYTLIGDTIYVHPTVAEPDEDTPATEVELSYYGRVPPLAEATEPTPLFRLSPKLYTYASLAQSATYFVDDQRSMVWDSNVTQLIKTMNDAAHTSRRVGSPIVMQVRSFG